MSENLNGNLNEEVRVVVEDAAVITTPIDDTLTISGDAADAKAVGDALALKADKSELQASIDVNGQSADNQGHIIVTAADTEMSGTDPTTVKDAIEAVAAKTAEDIPVSADPNAESIAEAIAGGAARTADRIAMSATDPTTVKAAVDALESRADDLGTAVENVNAKTAAQIVYSAQETIKQHVDAMEAGRVKSVYGVGPDENGDVSPESVPYAENLTSDEMIQVEEAFAQRTTAGQLGVNGSNVDAWILKLKGNREHTGFTPESIRPYIYAAPRQAPPAITAVLDKAAFIAYVRTAGTYVLEYSEIGWNASPALYGVTVSNEPADGDEITITWDGVNDPEMEVDAVARPVPPDITLDINRAEFVAAVPASATLTFSYTSDWDEDPEDYGITVNNEPVSGDQFMIVYVKEIRGTITPANPASMIATGWNLYDHTAGYAKVVKYSDSMGYRIGGSYTAISWCAAIGGATTAITPADGLFSVPGDGYVIVTGGSGADTFIVPYWTDWATRELAWEAYRQTVIDVSVIMAAAFPYGLCRVGDVQDEIDFNAKQTVSRVQRMDYSEAALAAAKATGRAYEYDENYIYLEREEAVTGSIAAEAEYQCDDHGLEYFTGTAVAVDTVILYGQNLKDKLRRYVVTWDMTVGELEAMGT